MTYTVCIIKENGRFVAIAPLLPDCRSEGSTREEALAKLGEQIDQMASRVEITSLEAPPIQPHSESGNFWLDTAGMFEDDDQYQEMLASIAEYRSLIPNLSYNLSDE